MDDHEASPSSSDCMTLRSDTRSPVSWRLKGDPDLFDVIDQYADVESDLKK